MLALTISSVFTLSSFAASNPTKLNGENRNGLKGENLLDLPTGRLVGTGQLMIDGNEAQSGVTVLSGSSVATGPDGNAAIELGTLGRIELEPNTVVTLMFSPNLVLVNISSVGRVVQSLPPGVMAHLNIQREHSRLEVRRGLVEVKSAERVRTLAAGEEGSFDHAAEAISKGDAEFVVEGSATRASAGNAGTSPNGGYISAGKIGLVALAGTAAAITVGVLSGRNDSSTRTTTPPKPSTIVP
jgi:hypothetical protein